MILFFLFDSSISFKVIDSIPLQYHDQSTNIPFLTKIRDIEQGMWDFGDEKIENYNNYYLKLLKINQ